MHLHDPAFRMRSKQVTVLHLHQLVMRVARFALSVIMGAGAARWVGAIDGTLPWRLDQRALHLLGPALFGTAMMAQALVRSADREADHEMRCWYGMTTLASYLGYCLLILR